MKKLIIILLLLSPIWAFTQTHTLTDKEVIGIDSLFQMYEQNDSIQKIEIILLGSQLNNFMNEKTVLLNERIDLYIDLTKELRPKWYNKPIVHFFLGAATITTAAIVLDKIK